MFEIINKLSKKTVKESVTEHTKQEVWQDFKKAQSMGKYKESNTLFRLYLDYDMIQMSIELDRLEKKFLKKQNCV